MNFTVQAFDSDGTIEAGEARYKLVSDTSWIATFSLTLDEVEQTPNITVEGTYNLQVRVKDDSDIWSEWFNAPTFQIGNCTPKITENISCSDYGVSYSNNTPGKGNEWEILIDLPTPALKNYTFELEFTSTRTDIPSTTTETVYVNVLIGETRGEYFLPTPDSGNASENWDIDQWSILSYTPNDYYYTIELPCGL